MQSGLIGGVTTLASLIAGGVLLGCSSGDEAAANDSALGTSSATMTATTSSGVGPGPTSGTVTPTPPVATPQAPVINPPVPNTGVTPNPTSPPTPGTSEPPVQPTEGPAPTTPNGDGGAGAVGGSDGVGGAGNESGEAGAGDGGDTAQGGGGASGSGGQPAGDDPMPWFSFFTTSMEGLLTLAPDPVNGFGGDFGGLAGADEICATLARNANPGDTKTWVAYLSTSGYNGGERVDAVDRIGAGPWYDFNGRLFAENVDGLFGNNGRPAGDAQLMEMFTDEYGDPIRPTEDVDNHDMLTGSDKAGRLFTEDDADGEAATCHDWTDTTVQGVIPVGHAWPRSANNGRDWSQEHTVNGCEPGIAIVQGGGPPEGDFTVGAGGGYGGFYCFALGAIPPTQ